MLEKGHAGRLLTSTARLRNIFIPSPLAFWYAGGVSSFTNISSPEPSKAQNTPMNDTPLTPAALNTLRDRLRREIRGETLTDEVSLGIYATDASLYQIAPLAVALPRDREDALAAIRICTEAGAPVIPRGAGTSLSGQTVGRGVVIDLSKHMRRVLELNVAERWVRVEPGLVRDELNVLLKPHGLHFAPDPATSNRANIGGMIANNTGGMRSIRYGTTINHVLEVEVALDGGETLRFGELSAEQYEAKSQQQDHEGEILRGFRQTVEANREEIELRFPKVPRNSGGFLLNAFSGPMPWNMAKLISGSEGALGVILEAKLNLEPLPKCQGLCVAHFETLEESLRAVQTIVARRPTAVELLDKLVLDIARENLLTKDLCGFLEGRPGAILIIEAAGDNAAEVDEQLNGVAEELKLKGLGYAYRMVLDAKGMADVWLMRTNGLGLMSSVKGTMKPQPFIEDPAVPLDVLPAYIADVLQICAKYQRPVSVYAHASVGLLHVRPLLDLHEWPEVELMKTISDEVVDLVLKYKGSISGEHGDGIVRSHYNEKFYGAPLYAAFKEIKRLFDPRGLFNPGKVVDGPSMIDHLRQQTPGYGMKWQGNMFHYREDEGLQSAIEKCNGVGACRKTVTGVMCPSYIATRMEEHSTRGRANALRLATTGQLGEGALASKRLAEVLDLCIACKGCKNECPNNVDMAKFKAEVGHQQHLAHGTKLRERMFKDFPERAKLASGRLAQLVNTVLEGAAVKAALDAAVGIDKRRTLPKFSSERLSAWFDARKQKTHGSNQKAEKRKVALFNDTYIEHHEPLIGKCAVEVLEAMGFEVELVAAGCCQRPAMSKGFLNQAKTKGTETMRNLDVYARQGIPIVVCEPSCASMLSDDLPDLIDDAELGRRVAGQIHVLEKFIETELAAGRATLPWKANGARPVEILFHGHCHQKAMNAAAPTRDLLARIPGAKVSEIACGCCGMAGAFGYEKEHYEISMQIGEDRLFPALRAASPEALIVADGFSCRHQIHDGVAKQARHAIEVIRERLEL